MFSLKYKTDKECLEAVKQDGSSIQFINNPCIEVLELLDDLSNACITKDMYEYIKENRPDLLV